MDRKDEKNTVNIRELVRILRSKNVGPVCFGFDIIFKDKKSYELGKEHITEKKIAELYNIPLERVISVIPYDQGLGIKIVIRRNVISGDHGDTDVIGAQQHVPLLSIRLPKE